MNTSVFRLLAVTLIALAAGGCKSPIMDYALGKSKSPATKPGSMLPAENLTANSGMENSLAATQQSPPEARISSLLQTGNSQLQSGNLPQAQTIYQQILQIDSHHPEAHHRLAVIADQFQNFSAAQNHYSAALEGKPNDASLLSDVGYSYLLQENYANSEHYLQQALNVNPQHKQALNNLGLLYSKQKNYEQSLAMFRRAGPEQEAQQKIAQLFPNRQPNQTAALAASGTQSTSPNFNQNLLSTNSIQAPSEETRQLKELMERERRKSIAERQQKNLPISQAGQRTVPPALPIGSQVQNVSQPQYQTLPAPQNFGQPSLQSLSAPSPQFRPGNQFGSTNPLTQQAPPQFNNQAIPQSNNGYKNGFFEPPANTAGPAFAPANSQAPQFGKPQFGTPQFGTPQFGTPPTQTISEQRPLPGFSQSPRNNAAERKSLNPLDSMPTWPAGNSQTIQQTAGTNPNVIIPEQWNGTSGAPVFPASQGVQPAAFSSQNGQFIPSQIPQSAMSQSTAQEYGIQHARFDSLPPNNVNVGGQTAAQYASMKNLEQAALLQGFNAGPGQPFPVLNNAASQPIHTQPMRQPPNSLQYPEENKALKGFQFTPPGQYQGSPPPAFSQQGTTSQLGSSFPAPGRQFNSVVPASAIAPGALPGQMQQHSAVQASRYAPSPGFGVQNTGSLTPQVVGPNGFPQTSSDYQATQDLLDQFEREIQQERAQFQQRQ